MIVAAIGSLRGLDARVAAVLVAALGGCDGPMFRAPAPTAESMDEAASRLAARAGRERELRSLEALRPGAIRALLDERLRAGSLDELREAGEMLFALDAPWSGDEAGARPLSPVHAAGRDAPDGTRCLGCHRAGGEGGAGRFADIAYFDGDGDDVRSAKPRLPRMLAGAALLERAAAGHPERAPFGAAPGRPPTLREMVRFSIRTHLGEPARDDEVDALATFLALVPPPVEMPPERPSLRPRAAHGRALFESIGCADCHRPSLDVTDPVLRLGRARIDLSAQLSPDGRAPFAVHAFSDLAPHDLGSATPDHAGPDAGTKFITTPLWGLASRGPFLHDGRAATLRDAIEAHGGEASKSRDAFNALYEKQTDLYVFLATLVRPPAWEIAR